MFDCIRLCCVVCVLLLRLLWFAFGLVCLCSLSCSCASMLLCDLSGLFGCVWFGLFDVL